MKIRYLFIAQFLAWAGYTIIDLIDEESSIFYDFKELTSIQVNYVMCFVIPIILAVLYFIRKKLSWNNGKMQLIKRKILRFVILIGTWFLITVISTIIISILALNNIWIVRQHQDGFKNLLNGVEYMFFGFNLLIIPIGLVLIGELLILIVVKSIAYWKLHKS